MALTDWAARNWLELGILLSILSTGLFLWRVCKRKLDHYGGFEGIIAERGKRLARNKLDVEEEIRHLEELLGRK